MDDDEYYEASEDGMDWRDQMDEVGFAELPYHPLSFHERDVPTLVAESRWSPVQYLGWVPSRLWDAETPTTRILVRLPA